MYAQHHRHAIWNIQQHPYRHNLAEFDFSNSAMPGVTNAENALNYIIAVLYPNAKAAVADVASLPSSGNTINDYRVVLDDGDGKQAAYRWEQREGDATPQWYKVADMDWSSDSILAQLLDITLPLYVSKNGRTDIDELGDPITGLYAGQIIYGGDQSNQNLTLNANSGDGVGPQTGYVQVDSQFRPTLDNTYDTGTATERWRSGYFATSVIVGTLTVAPASITDTSGTLSFDDENLVTTGNITGAIVTGTSLVADDTVNQLTLVPGSITDTSGAIDFDDENLSTTGTLAAGVTTLTGVGGGGPAVSQISQLNQTTENVTNSSFYLAQTFTTVGGFDLQQIDISVRDAGSLGGTLGLQVWGVSGGQPDDTNVIAVSSADVSAVPGTQTVISFNYSLTALAPATQYAIVLVTDSITGALAAGSTNTNPYAGGEYAFASSPGTNGTWSPAAATDLYFNIYAGAAASNETLVLNPAAGAGATITSSTGTIDFDDENLVTTGTLTVGDLTATQLNVDNLRLDNNRISITNTNGNLELQANGTGVVNVLSSLTTLSQTATGTVTITGQLNADNLRLDANIISSTNSNGNIVLSPNGTGAVITTSVFEPNGDNTLDVGRSLVKFRTGYFATSLNNGVNDFLMSELMGLRSTNYRDAGRTLAAQPGDTIFWDGSQWLASAPDTEIDHGSISGLLDDDHTQYMLLAGRAGGQNLIGGTAASETLTLESTTNATKGQVLTKDNFAPFTDASFSVTWSGTDLGGPSNYFRDLYTKGELRGARMENFTSGTLPASSAQNVGRFVFATDNNKAYVDTGSSFKVLGVSKFLADTVWNGTDTTKDVVVSSDIDDAREAIWALHDNANDFERIYTNIKAISATTVRITVSPALPAGSYRLIGIE